MDRLVFKLLSVLINSAFCGLLVMFVALDLKAEGATDDTDLGKVCCACQHSHERDIMAKAHCMDMMRVLKRDYNCTGDLGLFYYYDKDGRSYCPDISSDIAREKCDTLYMYSTHHGNSGFLESYFRQIRKCLAISWDKPDGSTGRLRDLKYQVLSCSVGNVSTDRLMEMAKEYVREQLQATCQIDPKRSVYLMVFTRNVWVVTGGGSVCWSNPTGLGEDSQLSITGGIHMTCNYIVRGCKEVHRGPCTKSLHCGVADNPRLTAECPCTNGRLNCPD
ncbi:MAG: hypothetical protein GX589_09335, partial [Deltaproteobacteria bacterium]|nr:hypothetical protein [Deltaproteobacteria bacterium]